MDLHHLLPTKLPTTLSNRSAKQLLKDLTSLYVKHRSRISRTVYVALLLALINRVRNAINEQKAAAARATAARRQGLVIGKAEGEAGGRKKVELNREFFRNLGRLLRICIPGWRSKELRLLVSHSVFLVLRTLISLYVAELDGRLVSSLVRGKGKAFLKGLVWWMIVAVPATFTNSMVSSRPIAVDSIACLTFDLHHSYRIIKQHYHWHTGPGSLIIYTTNTSTT